MDAESTYTSHQSDQRTASDVNFTNASNGTLVTAAREPQREKKKRHKLTTSARKLITLSADRQADQARRVSATYKLAKDLMHAIN